jgi:hypothetical protein
MNVPRVQRKVKSLLGRADLQPCFLLAKQFLLFGRNLSPRRERFKEKITKDTKSANMPPPPTHPETHEHLEPMTDQDTTFYSPSSHHGPNTYCRSVKVK